MNNVIASSSSEVAPALEGERKDTSTLGQGLHITMVKFQQLMSLLNKASRSDGENSKIPSRVNLSHSSPNQSHNSVLADLGVKKTLQIPHYCSCNLVCKELNHYSCHNINQIHFMLRSASTENSAFRFHSFKTNKKFTLLIEFWIHHCMHRCQLNPYLNLTVIEHEAELAVATWLHSSTPTLGRDSAVVLFATTTTLRPCP
ncbi:unnamed protein product [Sphenostylis stenocarpa]|uniref:Uncharacterized protein n=1 Tax=Sphenostylis stenocarpa TaxID=92480 RepID=A0AA86S6X8_9FABA|nr:unnamed protein product [Sphenostylis stenocarpa]